MTEVRTRGRDAVGVRRLRVGMAVTASAEVGGLETSFGRLAGELAAEGVEAEVLVDGGQGESRNGTYLSERMPTAYVRSLRSATLLMRRYDVVHIHAATCTAWSVRIALAARLRRVPVVVTMHLPTHPVASPRLRSKVKTGARVLLRGVIVRALGCTVYAPSGAAASVATRRLRFVPVTGLWNGVSDPGWGPVPASGPLRLVFVGRLADHKRPLEFIAAVDAAIAVGADVTAEIVGEGPLRPEVENAVAASAYQDRFTIHGHCADPTQQMRAGHLLVLTSMTEGCPLVAMEAAGTGRGVLARAGIEGLSEGWRGAFVAVPDHAGSAGFTEQLVRLAADRDEVVRLGAAARQRYEERFSAQRAAESLRAAYAAASGVRS